MTKYSIFVSVMALLAASTTTYAAVSADEAKQLGGGDLTPWGAERAGNKEGTIPEWTGQVKIPASYDPKKPGVRPDPFAAEKPLYSVTAQNMDKHADKLSEGMKAMLKKYPAFRIDVYPSHRTAVYPKYVIDHTLKNATSCKTKNNGLGITGCWGSVAFPIAKTGSEMMWNHVTSYKQYSWYAELRAWLVDPSGQQILQGLNSIYQESPFNRPDRTAAAADNEMYWLFRLDLTAPSRRVGEKMVIHDPVDMIGVGRRVWLYVPGQRRVKLAPDLAYDTPSPQSGGFSTMDQSQLFQGPQDRFDFKLVGKREMLIPYNNFSMYDASKCNSKVVLTKNFYNPDCMRFELHRVWVVEATLKPGFRNVMPKRTFYFDEDTYGTGLAEDYDASGKLYRVDWNSYVPYYEAEGGFVTDQYGTYDLQTGGWYTAGDAADTGGYYTVPSKGAGYYSPESVAGEGIR